MEIPVIERPVDKTELFIADEVFLSGTAAKVTPIRQIESTVLNAERPDECFEDQACGHHRRTGPRL